MHLYLPHPENALGVFSTFQSTSVIHSHIHIISEFPAIGETFILDLKDEANRSSEKEINSQLSTV